MCGACYYFIYCDHTCVPSSVSNRNWKFCVPTRFIKIKYEMCTSQCAAPCWVIVMVFWLKFYAYASATSKKYLDNPIAWVPGILFSIISLDLGHTIPTNIGGSPSFMQPFDKLISVFLSSAAQLASYFPSAPRGPVDPLCFVQRLGHFDMSSNIQ